SCRRERSVPPSQPTPTSISARRRQAGAPADGHAAAVALALSFTSRSGLSHSAVRESAIFLRDRRFGFISASTFGDSTVSAAFAALSRLLYASSTEAAIRPRDDTSKPLAAAHSRIVAVASRAADLRPAT